MLCVNHDTHRKVIARKPAGHLLRIVLPHYMAVRGANESNIKNLTGEGCQVVRAFGLTLDGATSGAICV